MVTVYPTIKVTVSKTSNALYVRTGSAKTILHTESLGENILVDIGEDRKVAGIEFLGVHGNQIEIDELLEKYTTYGEDTMISHEDAYFLRALSLIEWTLI